MSILVSLFHTTDPYTLVLLNEDLEVEEMFGDTQFTNAKGVVEFEDRIIVGHKDSDQSCFIVTYSKRDFSVLNKVFIEQTRDIHSICLLEDQLAVISTGTNEVHFYNLNSIFTELALNPAERIGINMTENRTSDKVHLNGVGTLGEEIIVSGFGGMENVTRWSSAKNGFLFNLSKNKKLNQKPLFHPHSVVIKREDIYYCESGSGKVYKGDNSILKNDEGYVRGLCVLDKAHCIYVGISLRSYDSTDSSAFRRPKIVRYDLKPVMKYEIGREVSLGSEGTEVYEVIFINP